MTARDAANDEGHRRTLPPFPVDDLVLTQLEHALGTCVVIADDGTRGLVGGEYTMSMLLEFLSGYEPDRATHVGYAGDTPIYESWDQHYTEHCVIRALVARIRELEAKIR